MNPSTTTPLKPLQGPESAARLARERAEAACETNWELTGGGVVAGAAIKVTLSQANLLGGLTASDTEHRANYEKNWTSVLDGLARVSTA